MASGSPSDQTAGATEVSLGAGDKRTSDERRSVLVIEDSPGTLATLTMILESSGYRVVTARDGLEALRKFDDEHPDLVLLDLDLPTISGFRLIELFRKAESAPAAPVLVVTGYDYEEAEEVVRAGAADLVTKPFDTRDLLGRIAFALRRVGSAASPLPSRASAIS